MFRCCSFKVRETCFGTPDELRPIIQKLKAPRELYVVEGGTIHSRSRSARTSRKKTHIKRCSTESHRGCDRLLRIDME